MDIWDVDALDGLVSLAIGDCGFTLSADDAERLGVALVRAAGIADWKATDDDEAGTPLVVLHHEEPPF